jgi:competence protein ComEC
MMAWIPYAFVRMVFFLGAGILTGLYFPDLLPAETVYILTIGLSLSFLLLAVTHLTDPGFFGLMTLYMAGWSNVILHTEVLNSHHLLRIEQQPVFYSVTLISPVEERARTWKQTGIVQHIYSENRWISCRGRVLLYFSKEAFQPFDYGQRLIIRGAPEQIKPPSNPAEFDYKKYLSYRNIHHQQFIADTGAVKVLDKQPPSYLMDVALRLRTKARNILHRHVQEPRQRAVVSALLLGITDGLDNELTQAYASAGAMHVLAVSGLHVGILYGILLFLFKPFIRTIRGKWILAGISIGVLWFYAFFTGLSPSVLRAVTMFTLLALARPVSYRTNIYNILAASAFILLVVDPFMLMSVGFQLSYLAVLGIVYLYPLLYHAWNPGSLILDKIWQITCVSLAAQSGTFVAGLLYFHQFPVYFIVSNLFVIPGAALVIITGLAVCISAPIPPIATLAGKLLSLFVDTLNAVVLIVEQLPYSIIEPVYITTPQSWLIFAGVVLAVLWFREQKKRWFVILTVCCIAIGLMQWHRYMTWTKPALLTVYHIPGMKAVEIKQNGHAFFYADSALIANPEKIRFHIRPGRMRSGIRKVHQTSLQTCCKGKNFLIAEHNESRILYLFGPTTDVPQKDFDYIIVGAYVKPPSQLINTLTFRKIILDSTHNSSTVKQWKQEAVRHGWDMHVVNNQGAFEAAL